MKISRFPKMMVLQKTRAEKLGFDEETAKAIGIAQAVKYSILKNISGDVRNAHKSGITKTRTVTDLIDLDKGQFKIFRIYSKDWKPFVGGEIYSSKDYDNYWLSKPKPEASRAVEKWSYSLVE